MEQSTGRRRISPALNLRLIILSAFLVPLLIGSLAAGGPIGAYSDQPIVWNIAANGPVRLRLDRGTLGKYDSAAAYDIISQAIEAWDTIQGSILQIRFDGYFDHNVTSVNDIIFTAADALTDGIVPIVIDDNGSITDAMLGAGAKNSVTGFALPISLDGRVFTDGRVVLNGSNQNRNSAAYLKTTTHELGHLFGIGHSQRTLQGNYPLMNPFSGELGEDDFLAMIRLYPDETVLSSRGDLGGRVLDGKGNPVSGVNIIAVDSATGLSYSTLSDYYSGDRGLFNGPIPARTGEWRFEDLPPGDYFVTMQGVHPDWKNGSSIGSYETPISVNMLGDWYNGANESASPLLDNTNQRTAIHVGSGSTVSNINFYLNDTTGLAWLRGTTTGGEQSYGLPQTYQSVRSVSYAVKFTAPSSGAPVMTRFWVSTYANLPNGGGVVVSVYRNDRSTGTDLPGTKIGSVRLPFEMLSTYLPNEVWLHEIPGLRMNAGEIFHIGLETEGSGRLDLDFVGGSQVGTSYLNGADQTWRSFPIQGSNGGTREGRLKLETWYSTVAVGDKVALLHTDVDRIVFDTTAIDAESGSTLQISSIGSEPLRIDGLSFTGGLTNSLRIADSVSFPIKVPPGSSVKIPLIFHPSNIGLLIGGVRINGNVQQSVAAEGVGIESSVQQLVTTVDFGRQLIGTTAQIDTIMIRNRGTELIVLQPLKLQGSGFRVIKPSSSVIFRPGDSVHLIVSFEPGAKQSYSATIPFTFVPARDTMRVELNGVGVDDLSGVDLATAGRGFSFRIGPNPASDELNVAIVQTLPGNQLVRGELFNLLGNRVGSADNSLTPDHLRFDLSGLTSGSYRLLLFTPEGRESLPVQIVR